MVRYETLLLAIPEITADEAASLESNFEKAIAENKASLISFERWGKYRLAYPVRKNDYGVYFLSRYEIPESHVDSLLKALNSLMAVKHNELVMRHMTCHIKANAPLAYHRPESLEEAPTRDVETFLKESKMTGLLNSKPDRVRSEGFKEDSVGEDLDDETEGA